MIELAFFRLPDGRAWLGVGPFTESAEMPAGTAFYINDFDLGDARPWKSPARLIEITDEAALTREIGASGDLGIVWEKPATEGFKMAFRRIRKDVLAGRLQKMVPVLTETGLLRSGTPLSLLHQVLRAPGSTWGYGLVRGDAGFAGATPELLFDCQGTQVQTMALAGTAKPGADEAFLSDVKEIDEHEIVASFLIDQLQELGTVQRAPRTLCETGGLRHFRSQIRVACAKPPVPDHLVRRLHPTPAVGCLPRTDECLARLREYRTFLKVPPFFGAPFGFSHDGRQSFVVSIRGICWENAKLTLPSGCGIVGGSAFDHEWRELRLKRESVARLLNLP